MAELVAAACMNAYIHTYIGVANVRIPKSVFPRKHTAISHNGCMGT
jgi:hypothetical protein